MQALQLPFAKQIDSVFILLFILYQKYKDIFSFIIYYIIVAIFVLDSNSDIDSNSDN